MPNTRSFARLWFDEVWNNHLESAIDELRDPTGRAFGFPSSASELSHDEFKEAYRQFNRAFSSIHVTVDEELVHADRIACRWSC